MTTKTKVIISTVVILISFAAGRFSSPEKIKIETKIVEVEKKISKTDKKKDTRVKVVTVERPDGTKETTKTIESTATSQNTSASSKSSDSHSVNETTRSSSRLNLSVLGGVSYSPFVGVKPVVGGHISKDIVGPISVGIWGTSNIEGGISLGVTF